jgi:chorismate dehydratase
MPFVYAVWAVRPGAELGPVAAALAEAKRRGRARVARIAHDEAPKLGLDAGFSRRYLTNIIYFDLGPRELEGLNQFYELACELGLAPQGVELEFYRAEHLAESR